MFGLEQSIAEWRRQMLAVGIKTPAPLEELESHLREEIQQQIKSGLSDQRAFEIAAREIGQPNVLENEFKRTNIETRCISQRFTSGMLVISGVSSLAILLAQFLRPRALDAATFASYFQSGKASFLDLYAAFGGGAQHTDFMNECLVLSLILTALFALLRFRFSKQTGVPRDA